MNDIHKELVIFCSFWACPCPRLAYARVGKVGVLRANGATSHPPAPGQG
ncbi:MAG: hypothetical protein NZ455_00580 [Bacteroidia bacterium]|nr:hypothetical protein [Bacteroidia bacterium]